MNIYAVAYFFEIDDLVVPTRASHQLGQALARYRGRAELSQTALVRSAGLRQATVSKVEGGAGTTDIETIYALCAALGLELVLRSRQTNLNKLKPEDIF